MKDRYARRDFVQSWIDEHYQQFYSYSDSNIDVEKCGDCNNCFLACKDEHVENDFPDFSLAQPRHGHSWINILRKERGHGSLMDVSFLPVLCMHYEPRVLRKQTGLSLGIRKGCNWPGFWLPSPNSSGSMKSWRASIRSKRTNLWLLFRGYQTRKTSRYSHIICGVSNVSMGLPRRRLMNRIFLTMAIYAGLDTLLVDVRDQVLLSSIYGAKVLINQDPHCLEYLKAYRAKKILV